MIIIHVMNNYHKRSIEGTLSQHLRTMPVVVVVGARQTGKSTLVQFSEHRGRRYETLDDLDTLSILTESPDSILSIDQDLTLDEVQRFPQILVNIKRILDQEHHRGRFLLTGSANLLVMRSVSESLAGRASYLTLWPMSRREKLGLGTCGIWDELVSNEVEIWIDLLTNQRQDEIVLTKNQDWHKLVKQGGYPTPALELNDEVERRIWFDGYVRTYLERDVLQLANVTNLIEFRRLVTVMCHRIGQIVNQTELGRTTAIPQSTVNRYLNLLEASYQLIRLPAYTENRVKRLIKSPKLYWSDPGLALHIAGTEPSGAHFENLILCDLLVWRDSSPSGAEIFHWRTTHGVDVDFVIETATGLIPIEVKTTSQPRLRDTTNLHAFLNEYKEDTRSGILIHTGSETAWLTKNVIAVPWWRIV